MIEDAVSVAQGGSLLAAVNPETKPIVSRLERLPDGSYAAYPVQDERG